MSSILAMCPRQVGGHPNFVSGVADSLKVTIFISLRTLAMENLGQKPGLPAKGGQVVFQSHLPVLTSHVYQVKLVMKL